MFDVFIADMQLAIQLGTSGTAEEDSVAFAMAAGLSTAITNKTLLQEQLESQVAAIQSHVSSMYTSAQLCTGMM